MRKFIFPFAIAPAFLLVSFSAFAQSKATIYIKKNQNGVQSEETREVEIQQGQSIEQILSEMGVLDELGQLKPGQDLEIKIDKSSGTDNLENLNFFLSPNGTQPLDLPNFAPAPPMENRAFLGVMLRENDEVENPKSNSKGVVITEVVPGSAAESAGLNAGDIILKMDKTEINHVNDVIQYVQSKKKNEKVELVILRNNKKKKVNALLGEKAMEPQFNSGFPIPPGANPNLNFRFGPDSITIYCPSIPNCILPNDSMKICQPFSWNGNGLAINETAYLGITPMESANTRGVRVTVLEESAAEKMGLRTGDIILEYKNIPVNSFDELASEIGKSKPGEIVTLLAERDGKEKEFTGELGKRSISGFDDFRIFHDFKGMDEGGNYFYDYEFDMDEKDVEQRMEELLKELDKQQLKIEEERSRIEGELDKLNQQNASVSISIRIEDISLDELNKVNENASPKLEIGNNLTLEQISFFPNPNNGILNLSFVSIEKKPVKIIVYNAFGDTVYLEERATFDGNYKNTIDISDQPNGSYFLQILQGGKSFSKKIVKNS